MVKNEIFKAGLGAEIGSKFHESMIFVVSWTLEIHPRTAAKFFLFDVH